MNVMETDFPCGFSGLYLLIILSPRLAVGGRDILVAQVSSIIGFVGRTKMAVAGLTISIRLLLPRGNGLLQQQLRASV